MARTYCTACIQGNADKYCMHFWTCAISETARNIQLRRQKSEKVFVSRFTFLSLKVVSRLFLSLQPVLSSFFRRNPKAKRVKSGHDPGKRANLKTPSHFIANFGWRCFVYEYAFIVLFYFESGSYTITACRMTYTLSAFFVREKDRDWNRLLFLLFREERRIPFRRDKKALWCSKQAGRFLVVRPKLAKCHLCGWLRLCIDERNQPLRFCSIGWYVRAFSPAFIQYLRELF